MYCYVGDLEHCPEGIDRVDWFDRAHPRDFARILLQRQAETMPTGFWTNNHYVVDLFPHNEVIVCGAHGRRVLTDCPQYDRWKDELSSGELWSMFGEHWIVDT